MLGTMSDINEKKLIDEAHKAAKERIELLLNSTAEAIYGIDTNGICTLVNNACIQTLGYDNKAQLIGLNMHELMHHTRVDGSSYPTKECQIYQAFLVGSGTHVDDEVFWRRDGSSFPAEYWSYPIRQSDEIIGSVVTFFDMTEQCRARMEREQLLHNMGERIKELQCMFGLTGIVRRRGNLHEMLQDAVRLIADGWRYPEYANVRIILDDMEYIDNPFVLTEWKMSSSLIVDSKYCGSVEVYYSKAFPELDEGPFLNQERHLIDAIATILSEAIEHRNAQEELEFLATHDSLTGLYNRKILEQRLSNEILRAARYERPLSIFMLDIDHFKQINDTYGHQAGDRVLQQFSKTLGNAVRRTDYSARYGGEEFVIVLPETPLVRALELAERLRSDSARQLIGLESGEELSVTVCVGVSTFPEHANTWTDLLHAADTAMYAAETAGRNKVMTA